MSACNQILEMQVLETRKRQGVLRIYLAVDEIMLQALEVASTFFYVPRQDHESVESKSG